MISHLPKRPWRQSEDEVVFRFVRECVLAFPPIWHGAAEGGPKARTVVALAQMNKFMRDDVVRQADR
jgi:hypothetical protein